jgi:hypothetical protein
MTEPHQTSRPGGRIVVKLRPTAIADSSHALRVLCDEIAAITAGRLVRPPTPTGRAVFQLPPGSDVHRMIEQVRRLQSVEYVEPDVIDKAQ